MNDEEKNENVEETPEADAPAEEASEAEAPAEEAPAEEATPAAAPAAAEPAEEAEPEETLTPKQARRRARSTHSGEARPPRSEEERIEERRAARAKLAADRRRRRTKERAAHTPSEGTPRPEREPGSKKVRQGKVVSSKADKTITVQVEVVRRHPVYEKVIRRSTTIHAHDERNEANAGDTVRVIESRPLSRTKRWRLTEILERAR